MVLVIKKKEEHITREGERVITNAIGTTTSLYRSLGARRQMTLAVVRLDTEDLLVHSLLGVHRDRSSGWDPSIRKVMSTAFHTNARAVVALTHTSVRQTASAITNVRLDSSTTKAEGESGMGNITECVYVVDHVLWIFVQRYAELSFQDL